MWWDTELPTDIPPVVEFEDGKCILTFSRVPSEKALSVILEVTENALKASDRPLQIEVRLPQEYYAET